MNKNNGIVNVNFDETNSEPNHLNRLPRTDLESQQVDLTEKYLEENFYFQKLKSENVLKSTAHYMRKYYTPSLSCGLTYFYKRLPFFKWIQDYNIKTNIIKDIVAGLTVRFIILENFNLENFVNNIFS